MMNTVSALTNFLQVREKEVGHRKGCTLENQPESLINETMCLASIDNSSVKLTGVGEPNNLYLHLAREMGIDRENG